RRQLDRLDNAGPCGPRRGDDRVSTWGRSFANLAPNKESHPIHPTQELPGSALSYIDLESAARRTEEQFKLRENADHQSDNCLSVDDCFFSGTPACAASPLP